MSEDFVKDDQTIEFIMAVKAICDNYDLDQKTLRKMTSFWGLEEEIFEEATYVRQISYGIPIPDCMAPNTERKLRLCHRYRGTNRNLEFDMTISPNPALDDPREFGLYEFKLKTDRGDFRLWALKTWRDYGPMGKMTTFVENKNYKKLLRCLVKIRNKTEDVRIPVLESKKLKEIYDNSIGFLEEGEKNKELYKKHNIPCKRGILLSGKPGCGKTLTCKWLRQICISRGLEYKVVTYEMYRGALSRGTVSSLFRLPSGRKGIIFFDDMDIMYQDKESGNTHIQTFLTELDGIDPTEGVVFVFTSNRIETLDSAFVRPGRVDLFMIFDAPNEKLRRRFIEETFQLDLIEAISKDKNDAIENIVKRTGKGLGKNESGYTFAEMEEVRKLMAVEFISSQKVDVDGKIEVEGKVDIDRVFLTFEKHREEFANRMEFGFGKLKSDQSILENYYEDDGVPWVPPGAF